MFICILEREGTNLNAAGIVVEYNPFHNGHAYHLKKTKEITGADVVIAVMSGNFLQRGEPAFVSKWVRTKMALKAGVDIVLELPYSFAVQKADTFAFGSVSILKEIGCQSICFGSEGGQIEDFYRTYDFLKTNHQQFNERIHHQMQKGVNYPTAVSNAFLALDHEDNYIDLSKPNNILGFHYVKTIKDQNFPMKAFTIQRSQADYHDEHFHNESIASATSIRKALFSNNNDITAISQFVPTTTYELIHSYKKEYGQFHHWENYWPYLKYKIIHSSMDDLRKIYDVNEGLENRIYSSALEADSFHQFMEKLKTKRYTWTKLQRMCVHILTNTTKEEMEETIKRPTYLRLLGMTNVGRKYLNKNKKSFSLPVISTLSASKNVPSIQLDVKVSRIYSFGALRSFQQKLLELEYRTPPIYIDKGQY